MAISQLVFKNLLQIMDEASQADGNPDQINEKEKTIILKRLDQYSEGCVAEGRKKNCKDGWIASKDYETRLCGDPKTWPKEYRCNIPGMNDESTPAKGFAKIALIREVMNASEVIQKMSPQQLTLLHKSLRQFSPTDMKNFPKLKSDQLINCAQEYPAQGNDTAGIGRAECELQTAGYKVHLDAPELNYSVDQISLLYCTGAAFFVPERMKVACKEYIVWKK
jgi:hypothetical protein